MNTATRSDAARRRPPPRRAHVETVEQITPRVLRVTLGGEGLAGFGPAKPSAHIKLLFDPDWTPGSDAPRPPSRTFTPLAFDAEARRLVLEFVLHGAGLAADWVRRAKPGDPVHVGGPSGGFDPAPGLSHIVMLCDDTAMPGAAMIAQTLPPGCTARIVAEVKDPGEQRAIGPVAADRVQWVQRIPDTPSAALEAALAAIDAPPDTLWWVACEAGAMRRIRHTLLRVRGMARDLVISRGYWRAGASNHPDHDYGED